MVKFHKVNPDDIPNFRAAHRGRVSYPILKGFLETGDAISMLDREGVQQSLQGLNSCLNSYIRSHRLPIAVFNRGGEVYLARTDTDDDGTPNAANNNIDTIDQKRPTVGHYSGAVSPNDLPDADEGILDNENFEHVEAE